MAKQKGIYFVGRRGNVIYYELNGGYYMRSVGTNIKQTEATKTRSTNFSIAARAGSTLRSLLLPVIPFTKDKLMQNRFGGAIMKWLKAKYIAAITTRHSAAFYTEFPV